MALINIEYGSVARSEVLNKNFLYLDEKIADSNTSVATNISSILSNIATINTRINDLADVISDYVDEFNSMLEEYKTKTKLLVNAATMLPNWSACQTIEDTTTFTAPANGYLMLTPKSNASGDIVINGVLVNFKVRNSGDDNSAQTVAIPVKEGDVASSDITFTSASFVPVLEVSIKGF